MNLRTQQLQRLPAASSALLGHCIQQHTPVLLAGLIDGWGARQWTFESLRRRLEQQEVTVLSDLPPRSGVLPSGQKNHERRLRFGEFVDQALRGDLPPCYLGYQRVQDLLPDWETGVDFQSLTGPQGQGTDTRLWIGSAQTCSGLHSDLKDNLFVQISGTKVVYLVPAHQSHLVHTFPDNLVNSQICPEAYDHQRFPRFARATVYRCLVVPGDLLFIPRGWWHYLRSETPSISLNHWFGAPVPSGVYLAQLLRLGPGAIARSVVDMVRYALLKSEYKRTFFFSPASTGERLYNWLRHGDFSRENDPAL